MADAKVINKSGTLKMTDETAAKKARGDNVPEESFLHRRHVAGEPHKDAHQREKESRHQDEQDPFHSITAGSRGWLPGI